MSSRIRVVAHRQDPVVMSRLVRVLIAQAQIELKQRPIKQEVERAKPAGRSQEQAS